MTTPSPDFARFYGLDRTVSSQKSLVPEGCVGFLDTESDERPITNDWFVNIVGAVEKARSSVDFNGPRRIVTPLYGKRSVSGTQQFYDIGTTLVYGTIPKGAVGFVTVGEYRQVTRGEWVVDDDTIIQCTASTSNQTKFIVVQPVYEPSTTNAPDETQAGDEIVPRLGPALIPVGDVIPSHRSLIPAGCIGFRTTDSVRSPIRGEWFLSSNSGIIETITTNIEVGPFRILEPVIEPLMEDESDYEYDAGYTAAPEPIIDYPISRIGAWEDIPENCIGFREDGDPREPQKGEWFILTPIGAIIQKKTSDAPYGDTRQIVVPVYAQTSSAPVINYSLDRVYRRDRQQIPVGCVGFREDGDPRPLQQGEWYVGRASGVVYRCTVKKTTGPFQAVVPIFSRSTEPSPSITYIDYPVSEVNEIYKLDIPAGCVGFRKADGPLRKPEMGEWFTTQSDSIMRCVMRYSDSPESARQILIPVIGQPGTSPALRRIEYPLIAVDAVFADNIPDNCVGFRALGGPRQPAIGEWYLTPSGKILRTMVGFGGETRQVLAPIIDDLDAAPQIDYPVSRVTGMSKRMTPDGCIGFVNRGEPREVRKNEWFVSLDGSIRFRANDLTGVITRQVVIPVFATGAGNPEPVPAPVPPPPFDMMIGYFRRTVDLSPPNEQFSP